MVNDATPIIMVDGKTTTLNKLLKICFQLLSCALTESSDAFPFDQGDGDDYFDEEGKSLRKALLKYPIEFTRISSRYSRNRFHPVAKVFRAHRGTDFAAAPGTPIRTVGDGIVEEAQYKTNNGNYVKVRHNGTYSTQYLHMSKRKVKVGDVVKQGDVIGYIGMTGNTSGPHVCYRFWKNDVQVDPLNQKLPAAEPMKEDVKPVYFNFIESIKQQLDAIEYSKINENISLKGNATK